MIEEWKKSVDNGKAFGVLLKDLSKVFDCLDHELLIAKVNVYGFAYIKTNTWLPIKQEKTNKINSSYRS